MGRREPLGCTIDGAPDAEGHTHCSCSLVTATGGECKMSGPPPTFAEAFPYLTPPPGRPVERTRGHEEDERE